MSNYPSCLILNVVPSIQFYISLKDFCDLKTVIKIELNIKLYICLKNINPLKSKPFLSYLTINKSI